jgi:hypothetical protein
MASRTASFRFSEEEASFTWACSRIGSDSRTIDAAIAANAAIAAFQP